MRCTGTRCVTRIAGSASQSSICSGREASMVDLYSVSRDRPQRRSWHLRPPAPDHLTFDDVTAAAGRLDGVAHRTPVITSRTLDDRVGAMVALKAETLQRVGAFKFRGAYNAVASLDDETRARGRVHRLLGQSRAGARAGVAAVRHPGDDHHARRRAAAQARRHRGLRRRGDHLRPLQRGTRGAPARARGRAVAGADPSVRRSAGDGGAGDARRRAAHGCRGARPARRPGGRRRADLWKRDRRRRAESADACHRGRARGIR